MSDIILVSFLFKARGQYSYVDISVFIWKGLKYVSLLGLFISSLLKLKMQ